MGMLPSSGFCWLLNRTECSLSTYMIECGLYLCTLFACDNFVFSQCFCARPSALLCVCLPKCVLYLCTVSARFNIPFLIVQSTLGLGAFEALQQSSVIRHFDSSCNE